MHLGKAKASAFGEKVGINVSKKSSGVEHLGKKAAIAFETKPRPVHLEQS